MTIRKVLLISVFFAVFAGTLPAQEMSLSEVIVRSARNVEEALPQGTMVAVLNFASTSETFSDYVVEELTGELVTGRKVAIVDRRSLSLIREEMNLQLSGEVSDESAQAIGRLLGAQSIVSGNLTNMGTYYRFRVRVNSVQSALIQTQISLDLRNDAQVAFLVGGSQTNAPPVASTPRQRPARPAQPPATPATPREPAENRQPTQSSDMAANARNNWIAGELSAVAIGVKYERMLSPKTSLGANFYWSPLGGFVPFTRGDVASDFEGGGFVIDVSFRVYPWGKTFFFGLSLGFCYSPYTTFTYGYDLYGHETRENQPRDMYGLAVTPEIGWKIDVGKAGGFYLRTGFAFPIIFGNDTGLFLRTHNFGMGYAF